MADATGSLNDELVQLARLATTGSRADVRLYISRLVRRYKSKDPLLAAELQGALQTIARQRPGRFGSDEDGAAEEGDDRRPSVLRSTALTLEQLPAPVLAPGLQREIDRLLRERSMAEELEQHGLRPASSAVFTGPPGVGKTRTARWIAAQLGLPLLSLDLTAVMSSRLGQSGANLRSALDTARNTPCVLFLDELDAIAKRRDDADDIGELKRLVTIMLQELDEWPSTSLLLAATNHPGLIDPALWRRFDVHLEFELPVGSELYAAVDRFLNGDPELSTYRDLFASLYAGRSFSDIERDLLSLRKWRILDDAAGSDGIRERLQSQITSLPRESRIRIADQLSATSAMSKRKIAEMTGVSRDTLRKHELAYASALDGDR